MFSYCLYLSLFDWSEMKMSYYIIICIIFLDNNCNVIILLIKYSNNWWNNIVDKGKGSGLRSHDYGNVVAEELGDLDANMSGGGGC